MSIDIKKIEEQYKYCFVCGGKLKYEKDKSLKCLACGKNTYIDPHPTNGGIILNSEGKIMLVKRAIEPKKDYWDLPGGFVDPGETAEESMRRELVEEIGRTVEDLKYFDSQPDFYEYQGITFPTLGLIFYGKTDEENFVPADDASEIKFFGKYEIPWEKLAFEGVKRALKKFIRSI